MEDDLKKIKMESTKINLIGCDTIVNSHSSKLLTKYNEYVFKSAFSSLYKLSYFTKKRL